MTPRPVRITQPLAREVAEEVAKLHGACIRPIALKRLDTRNGKQEIIDVPCGASLESKCPPCAKRNRHLRMAQCREGWHLAEEPVTSETTEEQRWLVEFRADMQAQRDAAAQADQDTTDLDAILDGLDAEITASGTRGSVLGRTTPKRSRSTKRRQDAPDLPKRRMVKTTLGRTFEAPDGNVYRPSLFVTLTLPSYGRVRNGAPVDPDAYEYRRAARDALHFSKLVDRFVQNLRRVAGYDVQYFAAVEPQKRLAPHLHMAIRGTLPRAEIKQIAAATYHQVWWPQADEVRFDGDHLPVWEDGYLDPESGEYLPTWDEALDDLGAEPMHVIRFGDQVDVKGVLSGTPDADQCIRYLSKYLTKSLGEDFAGRQDHVDRFVDALRYEPCSPTCPNWLRYGVQPKNARQGMLPGHCRSKAHKPDHLGYAGRRVLVSRKWSNKTLTVHKMDRRTWALEALGQPDEPSDPHRYIWRPVKPGDPDLPPLGLRLLRSIARRQQQRAELSATEGEAA
ncbi:replication initiator [Nonomuraea typhae]|uniref:replication initiator n=1 Tax=Nonomuraea typhae TaxID=2603600 RepID=UPI0012F934A1|nr:replication initiator [Nonomuraea typhae]